MFVNQVAKISKRIFKEVLFGVDFKKYIKEFHGAGSEEEKARLYSIIKSFSNIDEDSKVFAKNIEERTDLFFYSKPLTKEDYLKRKRLVSSEVKLLFLLHFICDSKGRIELARKSDLANTLKVSLSTVNRAICTLIGCGYILIKENVTRKGFLNCKIADYTEVFEKGSKGGYYNLSFENFEELISHKTGIDNLRLDLYVIYSSDFIPREDKTIYIDRTTMLNIAPSKAYQKAMRELGSIQSPIYSKQFENGVIKAIGYIHNDGKHVLKNAQDYAVEHIIPVYDAKTIYFNLEVDGQDIISLCKEFGVVPVTKALDLITPEEYPYLSTYFGARIRQIIELKELKPAIGQ